MQISLKWINELVNINQIHLNDLIEKLTFGGFEVEDIFEIQMETQNQMSLDISATANRSDSLSIQGISTEIAALLNQSVKSSTYSSNVSVWKKEILKGAKLLPLDQDCSIFCSVILENVTNTQVPKWIKEKLLSSGITPVNNLMDFQNYILLETGYPFACYDLDKLKSKLNNSKFTLSISNATNNEKFLAGNGNTYSLDDSILLVKANDIPISIAGISENQEFLYSNSTTSLLMEGSIFQASKIRQQSRHLGLRTDRSTRYEKSLKKTYLLEAFYRFILLLRLSNPNLKCKLQTLAKTIEEPSKPILLRYERILEILGPIQELSSGNLKYIPPQTVENYLKRLNFQFVFDEIKEIWNVQIPNSRSEDIYREIDLIEEVGRLHGFNNFLITLPKLNRIGTEDITYKTRKKIISCLLNLGLMEVMNYSFGNDKTFLENQIKLINPLLSDYSNLRISLLPNLIQTIQENLKQGNSVLNEFESGHIFWTDFDKKWKEKDSIAGILGGFQTKQSWSDSEKIFTWFEAKGKIKQFFDQLKLFVDWKTFQTKNMEFIFHPYRTADLYLQNGSKLGIFGQIHPILANQLNISSQLYLFEFDLEVIQKQLQENALVIYQEYSAYPKILKNISFIIKENIQFEELKKTLYSNGTEFLVEINLLDEYQGKSIPTEHISLCCQFSFQSKQKTLQNKDIEQIVNHLRSILIQKFNAIIRN